MKINSICLFGLAAMLLSSSVRLAASENSRAGMPMASHTLLLAQLDGAQVVGRSASRASETGAFLLDSAHHTLSFDLTYQGLEAGGPRSIALYNFGTGKNGARIATLYGLRARSCRKSVSATINGNIERDGGGTIDNPMITEIDTGRVYVEIIGASGKPDLEANHGEARIVVFTSRYPDGELFGNLMPVR